jgi:ABC-type multidrug transport system ATPase subunit
MGEVLTTDCLCKRYKQQVVLQDCSITVNQGDIYGFIGNNGAGKTTLMRVIMGLSAANSGTYRLFNVPAVSVDFSVRKRVSAIIEAPSFYPHLSGYQNLELHLLAYGHRVSSERIMQSLEAVGLSSEGKKKVRGYSLGMKQRLGLARALLVDADFIILDEPTNGLDPSGIRDLRELILSLNQNGTTFLISSHHINELSSFITKLGIIRKGHIVEEMEFQPLKKELDSRGETLEDYFLKRAN